MREAQIRVAGWARDPGDPAAPPFLPITGVYGPETVRAVRRFQEGYQIRERDGRVGPATWHLLDLLTRPDGSTAHFAWTELLRADPGHRVTGEIRENARRLMYKLEALRRKLGDVEVFVKAGFAADAAHIGETVISDGRMHAIGAAADITAYGVPRPRWYQAALTCGFTGLGPIDRHWQHCDSRLEHPVEGLTVPWFASGGGNG